MTLQACDSGCSAWCTATSSVAEQEFNNKELQRSQITKYWATDSGPWTVCILNNSSSFVVSSFLLWFFPWFMIERDLSNMMMALKWCRTKTHRSIYLSKGIILNCRTFLVEPKNKIRVENEVEINPLECYFLILELHLWLPFTKFEGSLVHWVCHVWWVILLTFV